MAFDRAENTGRRLFLEEAAVVLLASLLPRRLAASPCVQAPARITLADPEEKGERLRVRGRVFAPDGAHAASGVTVYAYQTDADGYYNRTPGAAPRLHGWMTSDAEGRFEYLTVRPGAYPGRGIAAHIHHQLWGAGWPAQYSADLLFEGDALISPAQRREAEALGRFGSIQQVQPGADGVAEVVHEMRLKPTGDVFQENARHGLAGCGLA